MTNGLSGNYSEFSLKIDDTLELSKKKKHGQRNIYNLYDIITAPQYERHSIKSICRTKTISTMVYSNESNHVYLAC